MCEYIHVSLECVQQCVVHEILSLVNSVEVVCIHVQMNPCSDNSTKHCLVLCGTLTAFFNGM